MRVHNEMLCFNKVCTGKIINEVSSLGKVFVLINHDDIMIVHYSFVCKFPCKYLVWFAESETVKQQYGFNEVWIDTTLLFLE